MTAELQGLLGRLVGMLDAAGVPFMVAGSFASTAHGVPRTTQDLGLVIDPPSAAALEALLRSIGDGTVRVDTCQQQLTHRLVVGPALLTL